MICPSQNDLQVRKVWGIAEWMVGAAREQRPTNRGQMFRASFLGIMSTCEILQYWPTLGAHS